MTTPIAVSSAKLDAIDHIAIQVENIAVAAAWYSSRFRCRISYQDETWAMLEFENVRLALVIPAQHPPHLALVSARAADFGPLKVHRDGTQSTYVQDPAGNAVEVLAPIPNTAA
jgi:catechol-2,3-dioxygenase